MNIIDDRNVRTIHRKLRKKQFDDELDLSTKRKKRCETVRLLDEGMVVDANGNPFFYIAKGTLQTYYDALPDDYEGSINLGHMEFATFPFLIGTWTKEDLHLVDIGDGRQALDVDLRLDDDSVFIKELRRMPYTLGVSAEFTFHRNETLSKKYGLEIIDGLFIRDFAIVGDAGNVNSSGIRLSEGGNAMTVRELSAALDAEQVSDLSDLNKKLDALIEGESEASAAEETAEEAVTEEAATEEAVTEEEATEEAVTEEEATEEVATEEDPAEEETVLAKVAGLLEALQKENAALKEELAEVKAQLSAKAKDEKEFMRLFKTLSASSGTERDATGDADDSADYVYTDGIGEV